MSKNHDVLNGMDQVPYGLFKSPIEYLMEKIILVMLFFSYFGVSTAFSRVPLLGSISIERLCGIFALIVIAAKLTSGYKPKTRQEGVYYLYIIFIFIYGAISLIWSINRLYSIRQFMNITIEMILASAILISFMDSDEKRLDGFILIIFVVNMVFAIFEMTTKHYLFQRSNEHITSYQEIIGLAPPLVGFYNTNDFCIAMVQLVPIIIFRYKSFIIRLGAISAAIFVTAFAWSDFALLAILVYTGVFFLWSCSQSRVRIAFSMLILAVVLILLPNAIDGLLGKTMIFQRLQKLTTDVSFISRTALYKNAMEISADHFGGGLGTGNSESLMSEYSATYADTLGKVNLHSFFLQLLVEYSWMGLFLFFAVLKSIFHAARKIPPGVDPDMKMLVYGSLAMIPFTFSSSSNSITSAIVWITPVFLIIHLKRAEQ